MLPVLQTLQPVFRVNAGIVDIHLEVQMVAGAVAGAAHIGDCLPLRDRLPGCGRQRRGMGVQRIDLVALCVRAVVDLHVVAPAVVPSGFHNDAVRSGIDGGAVTGSKVHTAVRGTRPPICFSKMAGDVAVACQRQNEGAVAAARQIAGEAIIGRITARIGNAHLRDRYAVQFLPIRLEQHFAPFYIEFRPAFPVLIERGHPDSLLILLHDGAAPGVGKVHQIVPPGYGLLGGSGFVVPGLAAGQSGRHIQVIVVARAISNGVVVAEPLDGTETEPELLSVGSKPCGTVVSL